MNNALPVINPTPTKKSTAELMKRHKEWKAKKGINNMQ